MLLPKPFYIEKMKNLHAHQAHHDDVHNAEAVPLQEHPELKAGAVTVLDAQHPDQHLQLAG